MAIEKEQEEAGIPEWVVTFGDMMSLLLTFFILLFAMSEVKQEQSQALIQSLRKQFGHANSVAAMVPGPMVPMNSAIAKLASMGRAQRLSTMNGGDKVKAPVGDNPRVRSLREADETTLGGVVDFAEGSAELSAQAIATIEATATIIRGKPQRIVIKGHTSAKPLPPDSPYCDHWDLAYDRTHRVYDELLRCGIRSERISFKQSAENEPLHILPGVEHRRKNARVEIRMSDDLVEDVKGTPEERRRLYSTGASVLETTSR